MYHIGFQPWNDIRNHFSGDLWIDRKTLALVKIDMTIGDAAIHPFVPIFRVDRLSNVEIKISHTFKNDGSSCKLDHINFSYNVNYKSVRDNPAVMEPSVIQREITTRGILCFYDYDDPFIIPRFDYDASYDDYRKMSIIPFNKTFWDSVKRFSLERSLPQNEIYTQRQINSSIMTDQYNLANLEVQLLLDITHAGDTFSCKS